MSDDTPAPELPPEPPEELPQASRQGMLADPVVRIMVYVSIALVIAYLAAAVGVLGTGVARKTSPRTLAEKEIMMASSQLTPQTAGDAWAPYINALIDAGDKTGARVALRRARSSATAGLPVPDLDFTEARLLRLGGDYEEAAALAEKAMKGYKAQLDAIIASSESSSTAVALDDGYYSAALLRAYALREVGRWKDVIAMFDVYIKKNPTAADILVDRGNAKISAKDKAGAEKDFRAALRFVPYDEQAKAGLKKIGAEQ